MLLPPYDHRTSSNGPPHHLRPTITPSRVFSGSSRRLLPTTAHHCSREPHHRTTFCSLTPSSGIATGRLPPSPNTITSSTEDHQNDDMHNMNAISVADHSNHCRYRILSPGFMLFYLTFVLLVFAFCQTVSCSSHSQPVT